MQEGEIVAASQLIHTGYLEHQRYSQDSVFMLLYCLLVNLNKLACPSVRLSFLGAATV